MRLNFSGVAEEEIREGVRRIGKIVREQVELFSTLTGGEPAAPAARTPRTPAAASEAGADAGGPPNVVPLPRRRAGGSA
jgi:2-aminoadipate transaminase